VHTTLRGNGVSADDSHRRTRRRALRRRAVPGWQAAVRGPGSATVGLNCTKVDEASNNLPGTPPPRNCWAFGSRPGGLQGPQAGPGAVLEGPVKGPDTSCGTPPTTTACPVQTGSDRPREQQPQPRPFRPGITVNQISWQVGTTAPGGRRRALAARGCREIQAGGPGHARLQWPHTYVYDVDGNTNELYCGMEQPADQSSSKPLGVYQVHAPG